jgi:hypothetical protein
MNIIGFTAKMQSGKTTAVKYLKERIPNVVTVNFKDALVWELRERFPEVLAEMVRVYERLDYNGMDPWSVDRLFKDKPALVRALMRNYGTEVRRKDDPEHWVRRWKFTISGYVPTDRVILVDDIRFVNEGNAVCEMGGSLYRIVLTGVIRSEDKHESESQMDQIEVDGTFENEYGDVEKLYQQLDAKFGHLYA